MPNVNEPSSRVGLAPPPNCKHHIPFTYTMSAQVYVNPKTVSRNHRRYTPSPVGRVGVGLLAARTQFQVVPHTIYIHPERSSVCKFENRQPKPPPIYPFPLWGRAGVGLLAARMQFQVVPHTIYIHLPRYPVCKQPFAKHTQTNPENP